MLSVIKISHWEQSSDPSRLSDWQHFVNATLSIVLPTISAYHQGHLVIEVHLNNVTSVKSLQRERTLGLRWVNSANLEEKIQIKFATEDACRQAADILGTVVNVRQLPSSNANSQMQSQPDRWQPSPASQSIAWMETAPQPLTSPLQYPSHRVNSSQSQRNVNLPYASPAHHGSAFSNQLQPATVQRPSSARQYRPYPDHQSITSRPHSAQANRQSVNTLQFQSRPLSATDYRHSSSSLLHPLDSQMTQSVSFGAPEIDPSLHPHDNSHANPELNQRHHRPEVGNLVSIMDVTNSVISNASPRVPVIPTSNQPNAQINRNDETTSPFPSFETEEGFRAWASQIISDKSFADYVKRVESFWQAHLNISSKK